MWQFWLIMAGACFIAEMITVGFFIFWFGIGALLALIVSLIFPSNIILQASVFVIASTLLVFCTKPLAKRITKSDKKINTNAYSILDKTGIVTQDINPTHGVGQIKVSGEKWSAKTSDGSIIEKGAQIKVISIDGVKAVVEPISVKTEILK